MLGLVTRTRDVLKGASGACRVPNSICHGWPQLWLPRAQQITVPSTTCEHAVFKVNHWQACQACAIGASAGGWGGNAPALAPTQGKTQPVHRLHN
jgi:hypothetical protein